MSFEFFIARRYFTSRHRQGFLSLLGAISIAVVVLSTASLLIVLSVMNGFENEVRSRIIGTMAHIMVSSRVSDTMENYEELREKIAGVEDVVATSPIVIEKSAISSKYETDGVVVRGIIPETESLVTDIGKYLITRDLSFETTDDRFVGVWLGINLANRLNVSITDKVRLYSLKDIEGGFAGFSPKIKNCMVVGIVESGMSTYDDNFVYMSITDAQELFDLGDAVTTIQVKTTDFYRAYDAAEKIGDLLGYRYDATDWKDFNRNLFSWMTLEKWMMFLVLMLFVLVAASNIIALLIMLVLAKRTDIGMLMAFGMSKSRLKKIFAFQGLIIGCVGGALGTALGLTLLLIQKKYEIISLPSDIYFISALPVDIRTLDVILILILAAVIGLMFSIYPAVRASRLDPVSIIRYE
ncbi:MAG: ABC transporter permease [candidate division Zixibacteria bacterium]